MKEMKTPALLALSVIGNLIVLAVLTVALLGLGGCANDSALRAQIAGANIELARHKAQTAQLPIMDATIPTPSGIMHIIVHAPHQGDAQVAMPDDPWARVADRGMGVIGTGLGIYLGGKAAVGLATATGAGITNALKVQPAPTVVTQPAPVIVQPAEPIVVTQPEPIIVPPADPVIVQQPEPTIVNPVIVNPIIVQPVVVQP
jgi:hypothetical protein